MITNERIEEEYGKGHCVGHRTSEREKDPSGWVIRVHITNSSEELM